MSPASGLDQPRLLPASIEARLTGCLGRVSGFFLLTVLAALWMSVVTWSNADPSLTHATGGEARNWLGLAGAVASDLLLETLGIATLALLLAPMFWGLELLFSEHIAGFRSKATYFPLSVLALAGALSSLDVSAAWPIEHGYGGILGDVIYKGTTTVLALANPERAGFAAGLLLFVTGLSALLHGAGLRFKDFVHLVVSPIGRAAGHWGRSWLALLSASAGGLGNAIARREGTDAHFPTESGYGTDRGWSAERREPVFGPVPFRDETGARVLTSAGPEFPATVELDDTDCSEPEFESPVHTMDCPSHLLDRGAEFDAGTDVSSRAIAERFAPASARRQVAAEAASRRQAPKPRFLRVMAPSKGEPAFNRPALNTLKRLGSPGQRAEFSQAMLRGTAHVLEDVLADFGVKGEVGGIKPGPVVTLFEFEPARGTKTSRIVALSDDIGRSMSVRSARVSVVPGRNAVGIELPNAEREPVGLRELLESEAFRRAEGALPLALGRSISGEPVVADLARMPHLLIAGTTGSGKSVGLNAMILSLLFRHSPEQCRFLMIDPKMLELSVYNGIPHLLCPVVTEPQKAVQALNWAVNEMEERYKLMARLGVRNIESLNDRVREAGERGQPLARTVQTGFDATTGQPRYERDVMDLEVIPYVVVVVDEFADLMLASGKEIELAVQRLAQKARAAGIHLIMATQRPSVDVITGTIKANFPTRISFKVASKIDSRTILNEQGAEQLLGHGDMLYASSSGQMVRVHGPMVSDAEVDSIVEFLRSQGRPQYVDNIGIAGQGGESVAFETAQEAHDGLYDRAVAVVLRDQKVSTSYIQRRLSIGYNRAADLIERMERDRIISAPNHAGRREIFAVGPVAAPRVA